MYTGSSSAFVWQRYANERVLGAVWVTCTYPTSNAANFAQYHCYDFVRSCGAVSKSNANGDGITSGCTHHQGKLMATLSKIHVPKALIVTLAIPLRYFPAIAQERRNIRDAMRIRHIQAVKLSPIATFFRCVDCYLTPLLISATKTVDELSAAAVTRGIDNPSATYSRAYLPMAVWDYLLLLVVILFLVMVICARVGML